MDHEKVVNQTENDVQDDAVYSDTNLSSIHVSSLSDSFAFGNHHKSPHEKTLERILHPCYASIVSVYPKLSALHEETLFYIFYMHPGDKIQESAFYLLLDLGYYFCTALGYFLNFTERHISEKLASGQSILDNARHRVVVFDPFSWEKVSREVLYDRDFVESLRYIVR